MRAALLLAALALTAGPVMAQDTMTHDHAAAPSAMDMTVPADATPATRASIAAMNAMHEHMMIDYTGDPDVDFALGMIPHHEAAIAMAKIQLQYGTDPELRKMSEAIVATQAAEVQQLRDWLAAHGH